MLTPTVRLMARLLLKKKLQDDNVSVTFFMYFRNTVLIFIVMLLCFIHMFNQRVNKFDGKKFMFWMM